MSAVLDAVRLPQVLLITGTGTGVGKTVVTAAVAAAARVQRRSVTAVKLVQTGQETGCSGDADVVAALTGIAVHEFLRFPEPLAPQAAARRAGVRLPPLTEHASRIAELADGHDLVLVEGSGGLLVRLDDAGSTLADLGSLLPGLTTAALVVAAAGLGTLNHTELTTRALAASGVPVLGVVIGAWPVSAGVAEDCNLADLPTLTGVPLVGVLPDGAPHLGPAGFVRSAPGWLAPCACGTASEGFAR